MPGTNTGKSQKTQTVEQGGYPAVPNGPSGMLLGRHTDELSAWLGAKLTPFRYHFLMH